ncbi:449_t:CDS:10 [Acaulospora colombiana]|uniref:449_t:CDS:1 n=1 Tax=Acaulospora colombiana TaxID=27376 RepID=A0ACA9KKU8_9GLOM|nr:449_t:CDS:10 [Acaulospora colombiana]
MISQSRNLCHKIYRLIIDRISGISPTLMANNFAINQLKKYGWSQGQGLGKNSEGRKKPIVVSEKNDTRGLGDNSADWSFEWWDHVYNNTLDNIKVSKTVDGDVKVSKVVGKSRIPRNQMGIISTSESRYTLSDATCNLESTNLGESEAGDSPSSKEQVVSRRFTYNSFVKSSTGPLDLNSMNKKPRQPNANEHLMPPSSTVLLAGTSENGDVSRDDDQNSKTSGGKRLRGHLDDFSTVWVSNHALLIKRMPEDDFSSASKRLIALRNHLENGAGDSQSQTEWRTSSPSQSLAARTNQDRKWNGHGYKDTFFKFNERGTAFLSGNRYSNFSSKEFHELRPWLEQTLRINLKTLCPAQPTIIDIPSPEVNHKFYDTIRPQGIIFSFAEQDRLSHGHGTSTKEIYKLRYGNLPRIPDAVIWPESHGQVELIILAAQTHDVGCIPYGGGSNDVDALECPSENRKRMIVSLDLRQMNRIVSLNAENMCVTVEAGAVAQDLEGELRKLGFTLGWDIELVVGGLASMRSRDFENGIVNVKIVTPAGTIQKNSVHPPPISSGPDITNLLLGSEGTLGVITELTFKLHHIVQKKIIDNCGGVHFVDEEGLQLVEAFSTAIPNVTTVFWDYIKRYYWKKMKGLSVGKMCLASLILNGEDAIKFETYKKRVHEVVERYGGVMVGRELSETMFFSSKGLPYLRDFLLDYYAVSDYIDTTTSWSNIEELVEGVKRIIITTCKTRGVKTRPYVGVRVDYLYDTGVGLTFIYGFNCRNLDDPLDALRCVERAALAEMLRLNGSVSHRASGIGKKKRKCLLESLPEPALEILKHVKR